MRGSSTKNQITNSRSLTGLATASESESPPSFPEIIEASVHICVSLISHRALGANCRWGALSRTAVAPLERVKILRGTTTPGFHSLGVYQSLSKLIKNEGLPGLYKEYDEAILVMVFVEHLNIKHAVIDFGRILAL
ncbi:hypothetical protein K1719_044566 [Acacia pycnantha]|nr:hypothetical protein K1719_044566 [Acacia pycnantha]